MAEQEIFRGFFSYARDDGETDPGLITALTTELERRINARLVNARLTIWRDAERLKVGERWDDAINGELRRADLLIVLLTPRWIGSEYCRKEFVFFEQLEATRGADQCVVPILARPVAPQESRFTPEQREIFGRINERQHFQALATDFLKLPRARRNAEIERLAEHIAGITEHLSDLRRPAGSSAAAGGGLPPSGVAPAPSRNALASRTSGRGSESDRPDLAVFRDAPFAPELIVLPSGEFMMGSTDEEYGRWDDERPQHRVTIGRRFAIGRYPVTFGEYDQFCEATQRWTLDDQGWGRGRRPVINITRLDAQAYIAWLSQGVGRRYRLPSEADWEYACRAGTATRYSFGDEIVPNDANYADSRLGRTSEAGSYPANPWGLYDMHGNVWEWVQDDWHPNYDGAPMDWSAWKDSGTPADVPSWVARGGSWMSDWRQCRSASRSQYCIINSLSILGFRVARTLS